MNTEERKELQTNTLKTKLLSLNEWSKSRSGYLWIGGSILIVAALSLLLYLNGSSKKSEGLIWAELENIDSREKLEKFIEVNRGNPQGKVAKAHLARLVLGFDGLDRAGTGNGDQRKEALANIAKGRDLYLELTTEYKGDPLMLYEAWAGAGKAEESLCATPKPDKPEEMLGSLDKALDYYQKAVASTTSEDGTKSLKEKIEKMKDKAERDRMFEFYKAQTEELKKLAEREKVPPLPSGDNPLFAPKKGGFNPFAPPVGGGGFGPLGGLPPDPLAK